LRLFRNCDILTKFQEEYSYYLETRDDDISCSKMEFCDERGVIVMATRVEDQAIKRIEVQQDYESQLANLRQDRDLLHSAMKDLTSSEYETIQQYHSNPSLPFNQALFNSAMSKLCAYISKDRADRIKTFQEAYVQDKQERLDKFRGNLTKYHKEIVRWKEYEG